jgi:HD superfamily phosphohydrolase
LETKNYYLLENHTPELSFDRWDYFMRDGHIIGIFPLEAIAQTIGSAKLKGNQLYFQDLQFAGSLCLASINTSELLYASHNPTAFAAWSILASAIRVGLDTGVLTQADLFATDSVVLAKMKSSDNKAINESLQRLRPSTEFIFSDDSEAEFSGQGKARYIDPLVDRGGKLVPVSKLIPGLSQRIESFKAQCRHISVKSKSGSNKSQ